MAELEQKVECVLVEVEFEGRCGGTAEASPGIVKE